MNNSISLAINDVIFFQSAPQIFSTPTQCGPTDLEVRGPIRTGPDQARSEVCPLIFFS